MKRLLVVAIAASGLVLVAASAVALAAERHAVVSTNYTVFLGEQTPPPGGFTKLPGSLNQFMPARLTIAAGDRVSFSSATFHTVTYVPKPPALLLPDPTKATYEGIVDSTGQPFYFDGLPKFIYNPAAFGPYGPKTISGRTPASSGALSPPGRKPVTATYTFPTAGVFHLICTVHPGMKGTIVVKPAGTPVPRTPAQVTAEALADTAKGWAKAQALAATTKPPAKTVYMGVGNTTTMLTYYPRVLKVPTGTTVTFVNRAPSEVHNIVFGPLKYVDKLVKQTDLFPQGPKGPNQVAPVLVYGSDPKPYTYDGTNHGNGFFATPLTAGAPGTPLPRVSRVTFSTAGTYKYICWIHGKDMNGTIVVTQ